MTFLDLRIINNLTWFWCLVIYYKNLFKHYLYIISNCECKDTIWIPSPKDKWTQAQKTQYNEFVESELENWVLINQTTSKVDLDDKKMKIDWFILNKIVLSTVRGDQFLYIFLKFDYKFSSQLLQYFFFYFSIPSSQSISSILYYLHLSFPPSTCRSNCWCWSLSHQSLTKVFR